MRQSVDWSRLGRRALLAGMVVLAVAQVYMQASGRQYGYDFRGGTWAAAKAVLAGHSPFPPVATAGYLTAHPNGFITPPPLALIGVPFALVPFPVAIVLFNLVCAAALLLALRLLDVRRAEVYVVVVCSFPFVTSVGLGQPDALFALGVAAAWRWRDSFGGALAAGAIIAAKLLGWPLVLWLLVTRRFRQAALASLWAAIILVGSWTVIGFRGLGSYVSLLRADSQAFGTHAHSFVTALSRSGIPLGAATVVGVLLAVLAATAVIAGARGSDLGLFTAALTLGILSSPVVWQHYLLLLLIPYVITRRPFDLAVWLLTLALWLSPSETPASLLQAWLIPLLACALAIRIGYLSRRAAAPVPATSTPATPAPARLPAMT